MATVHERFHEENVVLACGLDDGHGPGEIEGQRLLAEDVFPGLGGLDGPLGVQGVGGGDIDRLDVGVGQEVLVGAVGPHFAELAGEGLGFFLGSAADGHESAGLRAGQPLGECLGDVAGRQDTPSEFLAHLGFLLARGPASQGRVLKAETLPAEHAECKTAWTGGSRRGSCSSARRSIGPPGGVACRPSPGRKRSAARACERPRYAWVKSGPVIPLRRPSASPGRLRPVA